MGKVAPLSSGFMVVAFVGFIVSALKIYEISNPWGFTLMLFFVLLFIASIISMTYADADELIELDKRERR